MPSRAPTHKPSRFALPTSRGPETPRMRGAKLQARNARLARRSPLCVECEREGYATPVEEWDHRIALEDGGADDESNLQGLCRRHHRAKSARENAARRAARRSDAA